MIPHLSGAFVNKNTLSALFSRWKQKGGVRSPRTPIPADFLTKNVIPPPGLQNRYNLPAKNLIVREHIGH